MPAPKGNEFYKIRKKDGRDKKYTPEKLKDGANSYFQWCIKNPMMEAVLHQKTARLIDVPKMRPFTEAGLCVFLGISTTTFDNYKNDKGFVEVITHVQAIIRNQKFEGAAAGFFNANIIARDLGLRDDKKVEVGGNSGEPISIVFSTFDHDDD